MRIKLLAVLLALSPILAQNVSRAVIGGVRLTEDFSSPPPFRQSLRFAMEWTGDPRAPDPNAIGGAWTPMPYRSVLVGPASHYQPHRTISVEVHTERNPLIRSIALDSTTPPNRRLVNWEFTTQAKFRQQSRLQPFLETIYRRPMQNGNRIGFYSVTATGGVSARLWGLDVGPLVKVAHWGGNDSPGSKRPRNFGAMLFRISK